MSEVWLRYLVAAVQLILTGEAEVVDGELRIPADIIEGEPDGSCVTLNTEKEPGMVVITVGTVPPPEETLSLDGALDV